MRGSVLWGALLAWRAVAHAAKPLSNGSFSVPAIRADGAGNTTSSVDFGDGWYLNVTLGTPPQSFLVLGDSGSVNLAFGSTLLPEDQQSSAPQYNPNASTSAQQVDGYTYRSCFVSGYCSSGVVFRDVFTLGDLVIENQDFGVQTNHTRAGSGERTGTLGLNFDHDGQTTKPEKKQSWLQNIMPKLDAGVFTVDFDTNTSKGTYDFGYIDSAKYSGDIGYGAVVANSTQWTVNITGLELANGTMAVPEGWLTTIDTGTAGATVPENVAAAYFSQIDGATYHKAQRRYEYPCSSGLVDFTFAVGDFRGTVPASNLGAGPVDDGNTTTCRTKLNVADGDNGRGLWGRALIEEFFVVFDWDNARFGFASKAVAPPAETDPPSAGSLLRPLGGWGLVALQTVLMYTLLV